MVVFENDINCLAPVVVPTVPEVIPRSGGIDEATGRHMIGTVQVLDLESYRLTVSGRVDHPLSLSYDDLAACPK